MGAPNLLLAPGAISHRYAAAYKAGKQLLKKVPLNSIETERLFILLAIYFLFTFLKEFSGE